MFTAPALTLNLCYEKLIALNMSHEQPVTVLRVADESAVGRLRDAHATKSLLSPVINVS